MTWCFKPPPVFSKQTCARAFDVRGVNKNNPTRLQKAMNMLQKLPWFMHMLDYMTYCDHIEKVGYVRQVIDGAYCDFEATIMRDLSCFGIWLYARHLPTRFLCTDQKITIATAYVEQTLPTYWFRQVTKSNV
ncbi:MAG: hypothetical protein A2Z87_12585 [Gallionellales bacterium GWA2_54_124]|nr:MAG: hypothetical protein A2Z87_12585 [Gallionellales bacterium GWA2_54_124]